MCKWLDKCKRPPSYVLQIIISMHVCALSALHIFLNLSINSKRSLNITLQKLFDAHIYS